MIQFNNKPPKKLVVKNLKNKPKVSDEYEAAALARISSTIDSVFKDEQLPYGHEEIYRNCETLCKFHLAGPVYRTLYEKCEREAKNSADKLIKECDEVLDEVEYLKKVETCWDSFQRHYSLLESLFLYLDKVYIVQQSGSGGGQNHHFVHIKRFGLNFFRSYYLMNSFSIGKEMVEKLMILVERIRNEKDAANTTADNASAKPNNNNNITKRNSNPNFNLSKKLIEMIRELEEYSQGELEFEKVFIQRTWSFYEKESLEETRKQSIPEYLKYSFERLEFESEIISALLAPITRDKLMKCVRERLILDRMTSFLFPKPTGSCLRMLFGAGDKHSIKLLYDMINSVYGVESLSIEWTAFLRSHGQELMNKGDDYRTIEGIASFKVQVDEIIAECFQNDPVLQGTLKDAFESVMNGRGDRAAELLALYIHQKLQTESSSSASNPSECEGFLSMALLLFRYLHRKEAFDSFYKRTLAQRLLFNGSWKDLNLERQFISKLREDCGGGFVSRMESMLKDIEQSAELTKTFKKSDPSMSKGLSSVSGITVISGLWPSIGSSDEKIICMPSPVQKLEDSFNQFYLSQKKNCSLKWNELMGNVIMRWNNYDSKDHRYYLNMTIPQALIILQFNDNPTCSFDKLMQGANLEKKLTEDTLKSLSDPLYPILVKDEKEAKYKINEEFEFNGTGGKVPLYALQSPFLPVEEEIVNLLGEQQQHQHQQNSHHQQPSSQSQSSVTDSDKSGPFTVSLDLQGRINAMLMRRMKHQSRSNRKDLVNYILANLGNVRVSSGDVDNRVEELIGKGFLRMEDDNETVFYVRE